MVDITYYYEIYKDGTKLAYQRRKTTRSRANKMTTTKATSATPALPVTTTAAAAALVGWW